MLSPIENAHNYKFIVGFPMLASDVLIKFRLAAKNHNNLPRYFFYSGSPGFIVMFQA
jgi:hypothetical protein